MGVGVGSQMSITVLTRKDAPSSPTNVSAISLSSDTILVEWNEPLEPNGIVRYYVITVYESDYSLARNRTQENSTSADRSRTIGRLQPFTQYSVIVQAVTVEPGSESEVAVVRTNESVPGQVVIKTFSATSNTSLSLKWQRLQPADHIGIIIGYDILLTNSTSRSVLQRINVDGENQTMYNFTGLTPYTEYTVQVAAMNGTGPFSSNGTIEP